MSGGNATPVDPPPAGPVVFAKQASQGGLCPTDRRFLIVLLAGLALFYHLIRPGQFAYVNDSAVYVAGAASLAEGHGYRFIAHEGTPLIGIYPPLQSAYLACFWWLKPGFPANIPWLVTAMNLLALATAALVFLLLRRYEISPWASLWLTLGFALSPNWTGMLALLYSDVLFTLLAVIVMVGFMRVPEKQDRLFWPGLGLVFGAMYLTRSAAAAPILALGLLLTWLLRRGYGRAWLAFAVPVALAVAFWKWRMGPSPAYGDALRLRFEHAGGWPGYLAGCVGMAREYFNGLPFLDAVAPLLVRSSGLTLVKASGLAPVFDWLARLVGLGFMVCAVAGFIRQKSAPDRVAGWVVFAYLMQLVVWPYFLGPRVLFAVLPLLLAWTWKGGGYLSRRLPGRAIWRMALLVALMANALGNAWLAIKQRPVQEQLNEPAELAEAAAWMRDQLPAQARVAAGWQTPVMHLHAATGRRFVEDYFAEQADFVPLAWRSHREPAAYVLVTDHAPLCFRSDYLTELRVRTKAYPGLFEVAWRSSAGSYVLLKIDPVIQAAYLRDHFPEAR